MGGRVLLWLGLPPARFCDCCFLFFWCLVCIHGATNLARQQVTPRAPYRAVDQILFSSIEKALTHSGQTNERKQMQGFLDELRGAAVTADSAGPEHFRLFILEDAAQQCLEELQR